MPEMLTRTQWDVLLSESDWARHLAQQTLDGLRDSPMSTPPVWFYDAVGADLFDQITRLPEYYLTRAERSLLRHYATDIATASRARTLVELGAGSADKTRTLLASLRAGGTLERYVPVDCSRPALEGAVGRLRTEFPDLQVHGVVADFTAHLARLPGGPQRMIAFLGSTIGNFTTQERLVFLDQVGSQLRPGDTFLLGTDLVKPEWRLLRAYDDPAGVTAAFNLNALAVMNRHLGADFDPTGYQHEAVWDRSVSRIELRVVARRAQKVRFAGLDGHRVSLGPGDWIRTEISAKFTPEQLRDELEDAGMTTMAQWNDPRGDFLLTLAGKPELSVR